MRHHRMLILLFAATLVTATALAFTSAARAEGVVKFLGAENGKCLTSARDWSRTAGPHSGEVFTT